MVLQKYDPTSKGNPNNQGRRTVYNHAMDEFRFADDFDTQEGPQFGGIDLPTESLYQVNRTSRQDPYSDIPDVSNEVYSMFRAGRFGQPRQNQRPFRRDQQHPEGFVRLPYKLWTVLSDEFKKQIDNYNQDLPQNEDTQRRVHMQDSTPIEDPSHISDDPPQQPEQMVPNQLEAVDEDNPFMAMVTEQSQMTPDDIRHILSVNKGKRSEKVKHPVSRDVKAHVTYRFAQSNTSSHMQLVDRGANGGLAGADMKVLHKSGRKVNISGIDNHELTGLDIVTCASMYDTNEGRIIGIFHEYAYHGQGRSIHSSAQMEWFKTDIDDKSKAIGGQQRLVTLEGYVIPFEVTGGLVYMKPIGIPTDEDMAQYPHVFMTDPHEWDPCVLDYKYDSREEWEHLGHDPKDNYHEPRFNVYGESTERVIANLDFLLDDNPPPLISRKDDDSTSTNTTFVTAHTAHTAGAFQMAWGPVHHGIFNHITKAKDPYWEKLRPFFGYQPVEAIKATFKVTTRHGYEGTNTHMRKHFKSRNPALNVSRRSEPVATDFIFGPCPAVDNGCSKACLYVGRKTLVADAYPVKLDSQFINTLEDQIRERGAMDLLISDSAKSEISKKVKDLLRAYCIKDYQSESQHQHQNFAENRYGTIKCWVNTIMNRTGAHPSTWLLLCSLCVLVT